MKVPVLALAGPNGTGPSNSADRFAPLAAGGSVSSWQSNAQSAGMPVPYDGKVYNLFARFQTALTQGSYVLTVYKNGVSTGITCTIDTTHATASDQANQVSVSAGDQIAVFCHPVGTPTANTTVQISLVYEPTASGKSAVFCGHTSSSASQFLAPGMWNNGQLETAGEVVWPCDGTIDTIWAARSTAPGASGTVSYAVRVNGTDALSTSLTGASQTKNSNTGSVAVHAGDLVSIDVVAAGTVTAGAGQVGIGFTPATDGYTPMFAGSHVGLSASTTRYLNANGRMDGPGTTESDAYNVAPCDFTARLLYGKLGTAPGAGTSRTFTLRKGAPGALADTAVTINISGTNTAANDNVHSVAISAGDYLTLSSVPNSTPGASTDSYFGWVADTGGVVVTPANTNEAPSMSMMGVGS